MKAKKLPSGKWQARAYDYTDAYGKQHMKSFTADSKNEAELLAIQFMMNKEEHNLPDQNLKFKDAFDKYMEIKSEILSPSTIRTHKSKRKNFDCIENIPLNKITSTLMQEVVNNWAKTLSPKSVKNLYGILTSILAQFSPERKLVVHLPKVTPKTRYTPSESDLKALLKEVKGTKIELPILLGAFGMMRQGEICAFNKSDLTGNVLHISKNMVLNDNKEYVIKSPKTYTSDRYVELPQFVADKIRSMPSDTIEMNPKMIQGQFRRARIKAELRPFSFHSLRHYSASMYHALGIPDAYIMAQGGWKSDTVLKSVYRHALDDNQKKMNAIANNHFTDIYNN